MNRSKGSHFSVWPASFALLLSITLLAGCQGGGVPIDSDDIGGVVTSTEGPEAGVWVIAETTDLPTKFARIVVTNDQGQYVIPDLPDASYSVWVRGYGLVDSEKVQAAPGSSLNLTAVQAPSAAAAAEYYPAVYWFSMLDIPAKSEFPGTGPGGNGISPDVESQEDWLWRIKLAGCLTCHQLGNKATREIPEELGHFDSSVAAWERRLQSGQAGGQMIGRIVQNGQQRSLEMFADWTDRIASGELPHETPPRPQGIERNVVVTLWDWADPKVYLHDEISTDQRNPTVNADGKVYGTLELAADYAPVLDPVTHTASRIPLEVRDPNTPSTAEGGMPAPSPYWGDEVIWDSQANAHNPMLDQEGRLWLTARIRPPVSPDFCREGSSHPSARAFPLPPRSPNRQLAVYDPRTDEYKTVDTCYGNHHLYFAEDENDTLWSSSGAGGGPIIGWLNTKMYFETGDEAASQGWTPFILDTNGNGRRDDYVEPDQPIDPTKDKRIVAGYYGVAPNPADGTIWGSTLGFPGAMVRLDPGSNPSETALTEIYEPPYNTPDPNDVEGYGPRGMHIDRNGVVWAPLASGHMGSFDRSKCQGPLNGPEATGQHCPEGWTLYPLPGPQFSGVDAPGSAEASYFTWVDQFDTLGLGENVPIAMGNLNDALLALQNGQIVTLRVPYPLGFFPKGADGRIDDPQGGWKGRAVWSTYANRTPFHLEGGKGQTSKVVKFQIRPDPLAK
jgi:hypothetical protein